MKVTPTGDRMVFEVESESTAGAAYRVDLLTHGGRGACHCKDWETRRWPAIKEGAKIGTPEATCKHGAAAREFIKDTFGITEKILNALLIWLAKLEEKPTTPARQQRHEEPEEF